MRRTITTWGVATLLILGLSINVDAQVGGSITVGGGFLESGTHTLASEPTGDLEGRTCDVVIDVTNNESVWPGNQLRVESGGAALVLNGVEDGPGSVTHGTGQLIFGTTLDVILVVAEGSSLSATVSWLCPVVTTTTPPTTTTVPDTTTTVPGETTTTIPGETTTTVPVTPPTTTPPTTPPELPFTGVGSTLGLIVLGTTLMAGGVRMVRGRWGK